MSSKPPSSNTPSSMEAEAQSALRILVQIVDILKPRSLVDVGPGPGHWCRAAAALGLEGVSGFDEASEPYSTRVPADAVRPKERLFFARRFDLVVAVNMTLAIPPEEGRALIDDLCRAGDAILFSSPDPLQSTIDDHIHWPEYWAATFRERHYRCFDLFGRQPSLLEEPERLKRHAFIYARQGSEAANRLAPWTADGLIVSSYAPEAVLTLMAKTKAMVPDQIATHHRRYREDLKSTGKAPGSGFLAPDAAVGHSIERDRIRTEVMAPIERRAGMMIGERIGFEKGSRLQRTAADARMVQERAHHAEDIAELEGELRRLNATIKELTGSPLLRTLSAKIRQSGSPASAEHFKQARREREQRRQIDIIRASNLFDVDWYLECNPDIKGLDPIKHYVEFGAYEERRPSPSFDARAYADAHPQVAALNLLPFVHYIQGLTDEKVRQE